jgi:hypothetical protein
MTLGFPSQTSLTKNRTPALAKIVVPQSSNPGAAYGKCWNSFILDNTGSRPNGSEKYPPITDPSIEPMAFPPACQEKARGQSPDYIIGLYHITYLHFVILRLQSPLAQ